MGSAASGVEVRAWLKHRVDQFDDAAVAAVGHPLAARPGPVCLPLCDGGHGLERDGSRELLLCRVWCLVPLWTNSPATGSFRERRVCGGERIGLRFCSLLLHRRRVSHPGLVFPDRIRAVAVLQRPKLWRAPTPSSRFGTGVALPYLHCGAQSVGVRDGDGCRSCVSNGAAPVMTTSSTPGQMQTSSTGVGCVPHRKCCPSTLTFPSRSRCIVGG